MKAESTIARKPWAAAATTIATALLCNACCWLPPLAIAFTGTGAGFVAFLHPYRAYLVAFTAVQLTIGLLLVYRKPKAQAATCNHDHTALRTMNIRIMWCVVAFVVALNVWDAVSHHDHGSTPVVASHKIVS